MAINRANVRRLLQAFNFRTLFIEEMGWGSVPRTSPVPMEVNETRFMRRPIAQLSGVSVFEIYPAEANVKLPDAKTRAAIHKLIEGLSHENLLIFVDEEKEEDRTQSMWYWVKRDGKKKRPREHLYLQGQPGDLFLSKLDGMVVELDDLREDGTIPITEVTSRLADSLDVERVTKKFYNEFSTLRVDFIDMIQGIDREADRFWYASVLLNRLMFIYFLQKRGFIQNNGNYLDDKLEESKERGQDRYYSEFLNALFFEGFAKPENQRTDEAKALLGPIRYLNGGLFLRHQLEDPKKYPNIRVPDKAFENVLDLFGSYSWHLDDTPGANDNEINPDVLGYIFEKYINQKAFGAYYTRTEITQYLCERTIHAVILDRIHENSTRQFNDLNEVLVKLDADLCRLLLFTVLPKISILDPACGSGAFLVAAMKTLLDIYAAVYGKIRFLNDTNLTAHLKEIDKQHPSINYYVRKLIITDNLFGVDIMEEAAEIAKLRLFLVLVSSAQSVEQLEPLPNIDFNIMSGNSLIGLLRVDAKRFDAKRTAPDGKKQQMMFEDEKAQEYQRVLEEKNRLIEIYRNTSSLTDDLQSLRQKIDDHKAKAYDTLDPILLDDFQALGIQYERAQVKGKAKKRPLELADVRQLTPFHWGYEFDEILNVRGGFDIIITNPPWEIFKPQAKEFFAEHSDLVTKNKMTIKQFEKQKNKLLKDSEVREAWLEYLSRFPHVNDYYRSSSQYENQIVHANGRRVGTDINLYKLFTEQCFNLLRSGGQCGIVIPSGIYTDIGSKQLREMLFSETKITGLFGFENRQTIFEGVDSRFKFVVLTFEKDGETTSFPATFMRHDVHDLERFPDIGGLTIPVELVRRLSPDSMSISEFNNQIDIEIAEKAANMPLLSDGQNGWGIELYGEEVHMTRGSHYFQNQPTSNPLYEGSMIWQFDHMYAEPRIWIKESDVYEDFLQKRVRRIKGLKKAPKDMKNDFEVHRVAIRKIASNTNERTLIVTLLPKGAIAGNSLTVNFPHYHLPKKYNELQFPYTDTLVLIALLNSFVVDYILRSRMTTNLNSFYLYQLPVPRLRQGDRFYQEILERSAKLICTTSEFDDLAKEVGISSHKSGATNETQRNKLRAELDGIIAHLYGLNEDEFAYILSNFPIVTEPIKVATQNAYRDVERGLVK